MDHDILIGLVSATGVILIPILLFWLDTRRRHDDAQSETRERLIVIETKIEPIFAWWNRDDWNGPRRIEERRKSQI